MNDQNLDKVWYTRRQVAKQTENFDKRIYCVRPVAVAARSKA